MREKYEKDIAILEDQISLMESGRMQTKSMTAEHPEWFDSTAGTIELNKQIVESLKKIIEEHYPNGERLNPSE